MPRAPISQPVFVSARRIIARPWRKRARIAKPRALPHTAAPPERRSDQTWLLQAQRVANGARADLLARRVRLRDHRHVRRARVLRTCPRLAGPGCGAEPDAG